MLKAQSIKFTYESILTYHSYLSEQDNKT